MAANSRDRLFENMMMANNSPCFFCHQDSRKYFQSADDYGQPKRTEPVSTIHLFCPQNISRFLNSFEKCEEEDESGNRSRNIFKEVKGKLSEFDNDSVVPVCEQCSEMTKNFSELYEALLETKRRLECCVQRMHHVITNANNNESEIVEHDDHNERHLTVAMKMDGISPVTTPWINVQSVTTFHPNSDTADPLEPIITISYDDDDYHCPPPESSSSRSQNPQSKVREKRKKIPPNSNSDHMSNFTSTTSNKDKVTCKLCNKIMKRTSTLWHYTYSCRKGLLRHPPGKNFTALVNQGSPFSCNYCRKEFAGPKRANLLIHHWIRFHPEHFFLDEMNNLKEGVTKLQFQMTLHNILFPQVQGKQTKFNCYKCCIFCKKKFHCSSQVQRKYFLRKHLLYQHKPHLNQQLEIILRDSKLEERLSSFDSKGKSCNRQCGMYIPSWRKSQIHHKRYQCNFNLVMETNTGVKLSAEGRRIINEMDEFTLDTDDDDVKVEVPKKDFKIVGKCSTTTTTVSGRYPEFFDNVLKSTNACPFCRAQIQGKVNFRQHLILYHCKHLFPQHKLDWIEDPDFQKILVELLFRDFMSAIAADLETRCQFCKEKLHEPSYKVHFVLKHYEVLEKILENIQNDPNLHEELERCNPFGEICRCGIYVSSQRSRRSHETRHCTLTGPGTGTEVIMGNNKLEIQQLHGSSRNSDGDVNVEIITIGDDDDDDEPQRVRKPEEVSKRGRDKVMRCSYCRAKFSTFSSTTGLRHHMLTFHLKHFFPSDKYKLDCVSDSQFQKILAEILFDEYINIDEKNLSCQFCSKQYTITSGTRQLYWHGFAVKSHLIQFHFQELEKKLREIQKDPGLQERLEKCNVNGEFCGDCGQYLPSGDCKHEKLHCPGRTRK